MAYNPNIHHRRSIRLKGYDYTQEGLYFITICCAENACLFGRIISDETGQPQMKLNNLGKIAHNEWLKLPNRFPNLELDVFQIMPNHLHAILEIKEIKVRAGFTPAPAIPPAPAPELAPDSARSFTQISDSIHTLSDLAVTSGARNWAGVNPAPTVGNVIGAYKSLVARECLKIFKSKNETMGKLWLRNYYEHIIRNERGYQNIANYIINNPAKWQEEKFFTTDTSSTAQAVQAQ
ncbi:transposase [Botryobacter ruber]|uniref:transposase n=1 Tax=Botryobacter ruber TaxID=2171629 RepID=UPI000E0A1DD3|nr:transposase [Botryobacter ruber]